MLLPVDRPNADGLEHRPLVPIQNFTKAFNPSICIVCLFLNLEYFLQSGISRKSLNYKNEQQ